MADKVEYTNTCTICLDEITDNISYLPCCHGFHQECFNSYITEKIKSKKDISCPVCRIEHFKYGERNYQFIMNELGIVYESENNRIPAYQQYIPASVHNGSRIPSYLQNIPTSPDNRNRTYNDISMPYIPHSVITMPINTTNNLQRRPTTMRQQQTTCNIVWYKCRYYVIGLILMGVLSYVSFLIISTFNQKM
jgi:hypothetical protein